MQLSIHFLAARELSREDPRRWPLSTRCTIYTQPSLGKRHGDGQSNAVRLDGRARETRQRCASRGGEELLARPALRTETLAATTPSPCIATAPIRCAIRCSLATGDGAPETIAPRTTARARSAVGRRAAPAPRLETCSNPQRRRWAYRAGREERPISQFGRLPLALIPL